jgi:hypothetical protein
MLAPALATHRRLSAQRLLGVAVILFLLAGAWWWRTTQDRLHQAEMETRETVQKEFEAVVLRDDQASLDWDYQLAQQGRSLPAAVWPANPEAQLPLAIDTLAMQGDRAVARVRLLARNGEVTYRQTRFYRRTAEGWQRTPPDPALWGPERSLATTFFIFHFHQNDAAAVIAIAPQLDALYTILRHNVGLGLPPSGEKQAIDVRVTEPPGQASLWFGAPERITVASPAVYWAPVEVTDAELLEQSIALPLLDGVIAQASEHYALGSTWRPMLRGLRLWQVWDLNLPLAAWRADVVQRLYVDLPAADPKQPAPLPEHYRELCAAHKLWMPSPLQIDIPFVCAEQERENEYFAMGSQRNPPIRLDQLAVPVPLVEDLVQSSGADQVNHPGQAVALATLIEYAVAAYGRERLPMLVAGLGQYDTWDTLIPAVFGISASEFEAGWQVYLAERYAVSLP